MYIENEEELFSILKKAGYKVIPPKHKNHYIIIGGHIGRPIGCCCDRLDALFEEPDSTFEKVKKKDCPICSKDIE